MEEPPEKSSDPFIFQLSETVKGSTQAHFSTDDQHPIDDTPPKETHVIDQDSLSSNHSNSLTRLPVNIPTLVHGFSDGGFLEDKRMAAGWWLSVDNKIAHAKGTIVSWKSSSNNVAEYFGLIRALETALDRHHTHLAMNMDSLLVVQQLLGHWRCKNPILVELLQYARSLADQFTFFSIQHTLREGNTVADTLCNMAFDGFKGGLNDWKCALDRTTALHEVRASQASWNYQNISPNWDETWSIVMEELKAIGPMLRNMYLPGIPLFEEFIPPPPMSLPLTPEVKPIAVTGQPWPYVIEAAGLSEMKLLAAEANITWDHNRYRLLIPTVNTHGVKVLPYPTEDAQYTTAILAGINWDLPRLIRAWRGQTKMDPRPNKALDFSRITKSTVGYEKRKELEEIITHGYGLHWTAPHVGVRPLPKNQPSADANAEIMSAMILKQYKKGRLMVMNAEDVAKHVPQFATSPYGCVAKANKPLTHTCRPIHNQSAPVGSSINEGLDSSLRPDATWPGVSHIADRILDASTTYGASTLKAFVTDITDAFIQVGLADTDVQVNGGVLPLSNIATLATSCVFGNCESPAAFKILNCVPHIHRQLGSCVNGVNTPFDVRFYVDDGNAIEPDIGDRLKIAEASLRKSVTDVFGNDSIQEDKTSSWASSFTSLGYSWDLPSGTVSIPQEKLLRVKNELVRFSGLSTATVTEFRSLVGKLRHVATCCKPAGSLMQLLGGGLSAHKVSSGRQKKKITPAMRTELMWWASFLTPARFHNLPVEWLGTRENKVTNWLHCYSTPSVGVWLINQSEGSSQFTPWDSSLLRTVLKCLKSCLVNHHRSVRMTHTRILINECSIAKTLNRGSSPSHVVQDLLKSIGMWQLDHRHRITATTPSWERSPPLSISPCLFHPSNTNFLFQISKTMTSAKRSPPSLTLGKQLQSQRAHAPLIYETLNTGSCFVPRSTYRAFGSTNSSRVNKQRLWYGLRSTAVPTATIKSKKEISTARTSTRKPLSSGLTGTTEMPFYTSTAHLSSWWRLPINATKTARSLNSRVLPKCCSAATRNSSLPLMARSRGVFSSSNISFSEEVGSSGPQIMQESDSIKQNVIIGFNGMTSSFKTAKVTPSTGRNRNELIRCRSPSTMPRLTRLEEETSLLWEPLDIQSYAPSVEPSSPYAVEALGSPKVARTPCLEALNRHTSQGSSNEQLKPRGSTRSLLPAIPYELVTPPPSLTPDTMNWSSVWLEGGLAKQSLATPASLVRSY